MLKADLKAKWNQYCDTDKLVDDVMALLTKYHHKNTEYGVCKMLDVYFTNKKDLIDMFTTSERYVGDMRIIIDIELERMTNQDDVFVFCDDFPRAVDSKSAILKCVDENGKTFQDYTRTGFAKFKARNLLDKEVRSKLELRKQNQDKFYKDGTTRASHMENDKFNKIMCNVFSLNHQSVLTQGTVEGITQHKINGSFVEGMKTSRAFNRVCAYYGVDKLPNYNKLFAQYADMVSGLKRKLKFFISVNPLDYLTMSFGVNWASCHTIDQQNERNMPSHYSGTYCGGTMSYMLDHVSFITYVHDKIPTDVEEGKIYRNMFHYGNDLLVQGRIYPQGNDGATDLYAEFRRIVQNEFSQLLELTSDIWVRRKNGCSENIVSEGVHYKDYLNFEQCNVTYPKEKSCANINAITIGHNRICPYCGMRINGEIGASSLTHRNCVVVVEASTISYTVNI